MIWIHLEPEKQYIKKREQNSSLWINLPGRDSKRDLRNFQSNCANSAIGLVAYACGISPRKKKTAPHFVILFKGLYSGTSDGSFV
ncbi:hypothetical protein TNCV_859411 [Trichonephila clavipes]|nr:hypothetical protein TNCV_859411 [Trichonephila clavipes]